MTFPKPLPGVKMRGKVDGELWSAGAAYTDWSRLHPRSWPHYFNGILRHQGSPRWTCSHEDHETTEEARICAAAELARRLATQENA